MNTWNGSAINNSFAQRDDEKFYQSQSVQIYADKPW